MGLIDEIKNHDEEMINTVVLPLLNVSRRLPDNSVNPKEINQQVICATSAWQKTSFAYDRLIDDFEQSIIDPSRSFVFGCDYRVPVLHGLLDKGYIQNLKLSPSFNETTFSTEYLSRWVGASADSWFDFEKIMKYRKLKNPELHAINREGAHQFYLLSVDVGRIHDQTVITVFRVNIDSQGYYRVAVVNIMVIGRDAKSKTFYQQAIDIKRQINLYNPREVVIDTNGIGVSLGDEMIRSQVDENGVEYPPYGFVNDDTYQQIQPSNALKILYSFKATGPLKSKVHGAVYSKLSSGSIKFLIKEQEAKSALLATKAGQRMTVEQRVKRLMPHEMTTKLFDEMSNLRLKKTGTADIVLEQINSKYPDDKYMSFAYGVWRISEMEQEEYTRKKRRGKPGRKLTFFTEVNNARK